MGGRDAEDGRGARRAGPQGLRHSRRRLERDRRPRATSPACRSCSSRGSSMGVALDHVVVGSGSSGTHGGMVAGFLGNNIGTSARSASASAAIPPTRSRWCCRRRRRVLDLLGVGIRCRRGGAVRRRLLAAEVLGAQRADGRGRADAGAHRRRPARPGLHRQDHGRPDRPGAGRATSATGERAVHAHRRAAGTLRLRAGAARG